MEDNAHGRRNNISMLGGCYGCGVCVCVCPKQIITLEEDTEGFYRARIRDTAGCVDCGICLEVCAHAHTEVAPLPKFEPRGYAAWSNNESIRYKCTSGGIAFVLASTLIEQGYTAIGVRYNKDLKRAEHFAANTPQDFLPSIGSKYIPSYTLPGFRELRGKGRFFVSGTPCQIDSLRRYIRMRKIEDRFVLLDFVCHSIPSLRMWRKYLESLERKLGKPVEHIVWRDKLEGWQMSPAIGVFDKEDEDEHLLFSPSARGDLFFTFFFRDRCSSACCYDTCKYKQRASAADIRVCDLWGKTYLKNDKGVSGVIALTERGDNLLRQLLGCSFEEIPTSVVLEGQLHKNANRPVSYNYVHRKLRTEATIEQIDRGAKALESIWGMPKRLRYYWSRLPYKLKLKSQ